MVILLGHPGLSPEGDHSIEVGSASLKPAVGEEALVGPAAVDLHTLGLGPGPQSVCVTRPAHGKMESIYESFMILRRALKTFSYNQRDLDFIVLCLNQKVLRIVSPVHCMYAPCSVASQHVSVAAGVAHHRLVADRRVLRLA